MKSKVLRGSGFAGAIRYVTGAGKDAERVAGNLSGQTARQLTSEFAISRELRPDISRPVWHASLSLPAGEHLETDRWQTVVEEYMQGMGLDPDNHQFLAVRHSDTDYDHVHVVASRIGLDGSVFHGKWEAKQSIGLTQQLEQRHGLTQTQGYYKKDRKTLSHNELNMAARTGKEPPRQALQRLVDEAAADGPSASVFAERLTESGVTVRPNVAGTGRLNGFSFEYDGVSYKASDLGKKYGWKQLQKRYGVTYEQNRDGPQLERLAQGAGTEPGHADDEGPTEPRGRAGRAADERNVPADGYDQQRSGTDRASQDSEPESGAAPAPAPEERARAAAAPEERAGATGSADRETGESAAEARESGDAAAAQGSLVDVGGGGDWSIDRITDHLRYHLASDVTPAKPDPMPEPTEPGPTRAEREITDTVAAHPAPEHEGSVWGVQRLKLWYQSLKRRLSSAIEQAREHWKQESTASAEAAGWTEDERERAGVEPPATASGLGREKEPEPAPQAEPEPESVTDNPVPEPEPDERDQFRKQVMADEGEPVILDEIVQDESGQLRWEPIPSDQLTEEQAAAIEDARDQLAECGPSLR